MKNSTLVFISGLIWSVIGCILLSVGIFFVFKGHKPILIFFGFPLGYIKGRTVLKRSAMRQIGRLTQLKKPVIFDLFTKGFMILMGVMMCLGFVLKYCPFAIRGVIDMAVGFGLIVGSSYYYRKEIVT